MTRYYRVQETELDRFTRQVFEACGMTPEGAAILADNLVQGELHGLGSHGVSRLLPTYAQRLLGAASTHGRRCACCRAAARRAWSTATPAPARWWGSSPWTWSWRWPASSAPAG